MAAMNPYVVPKRAVPVEVVDGDGTERKLLVFVAPSASGHDGPERVSDLLQGGLDFIPAVEQGSQAPVWLGRASLFLLRLDDALERGGAEEHTLPTEHELDVILSNGSVERGLVSYVLPAGRARLTDYLNDGLPFLRLLQAGAVVLVNKRHVVRVAPSGS